MFKTSGYGSLSLTRDPQGGPKGCRDTALAVSNDEPHTDAPSLNQRPIDGMHRSTLIRVILPSQ